MYFEHDEDDAPPKEAYGFWYFANRWAEESLRWLRAFGFLLVFLYPAFAQEVETRVATFCDQPEQVRWLNAGAPITLINQQSPNACGTFGAAFYRGKRVDSSYHDDIFAVLVVGLVTPHGVQQGTPMVQFAALEDAKVIRVQHNHAQGHNDYANWSSRKIQNCCNNDDCGEAQDEDVQDTPQGTFVRIEKEWCPVLSQHYITKGKSPDWSKSHVCVGKSTYYMALPPCERLLCYSGKGGT